MQESWLGLVLMIAIIMVGLVASVLLSKNQTQKKACVATFSLLAILTLLFCLITIYFSQLWTVYLFIICFMVIPIVIHPVAFSYISRRSASRTPKSFFIKTAKPASKSTSSDTPSKPVEKAKEVFQPISARKQRASVMSFDDTPVTTKSARPTTETKPLFTKSDSPETKPAPSVSVDRMPKPRRQEQELTPKHAAADQKTAPLATPAVKQAPESATAPTPIPAPIKAVTPTPVPTAKPARTSAHTPAPAPLEAVVTAPTTTPTPASTSAPAPVLTPKPSTPMPVEKTPFDSYFEKAESLKAKGLDAVAARLFEESVQYASDQKQTHKALFEAMSLYVKVDALDQAKDIAKRLQVYVDELSLVEVVKLDAVLRMA